MLIWNSWLLTVAATCTLVVSAGYVALIKLHVARHILAFVLRRVLRTVCDTTDGRSDSYRVTSDQSGTTLKSARISSLGYFQKFQDHHAHQRLRLRCACLGILVEALELGSKVRSLAGNDLFIFSALRLQRCHIQLPNLHQPLYIQILGAHAELTQRQLPEVLICKCMRSC